MARVLAKQKMLGVTSIINNPDVQAEFEACFLYFINNVHLVHHSTIVGSIAAALRGLFGDHAVNLKTQLAPVWVSPLTTLLWFFDLQAVAQSKLYYQAALRSETPREIMDVISKCQRTKTARTPIPI
jgi:hypothetical protein